MKYNEGKKNNKQAPEKDSGYVLSTAMVVGIVLNRGYKEGKYSRDFWGPEAPEVLNSGNGFGHLTTGCCFVKLKHWFQ